MAPTLAAAPPAPAVPQIAARRWRTLAIVLGGTFMAIFDVFVVNVAIPTMQRDLRASFAQIQFVLAGYALAYAVMLVTGGRLGDVYGRRRLFTLGMAGFVVASGCCGLAPTPFVLIAARVAQGLAAAMMTPQVLSTIQVTFPPPERSRALGMFGAVVGIAGSAGQAIGGLIIRADLFGLSWRPVFLINLPIGIGLLIAARTLPESRSATAPRLDLGGVAILTAGLFLLAFPLVAGRDAGWPAWAFASLAAAIPVLAAFVRFERRVAARGGSPLVVLRLFRARAFVAGLLVLLPFNAASSASFLLLALYLQVGLHYSALAAGLVFAPGALCFFVAATFSARLVARLGNRTIAVGLAVLIAAYAMNAAVVLLAGEAPPAALIALAIVVQGFGAGTTAPTNTGAVLSGVDRDDAGAASGVLTTCQQIGGALGVAIIGVIFFGALAGIAPRVGGDLAPQLDRQLAGAIPGDAERAATVADFRTCAEDRARSRDPAIAPAGCQQPSLRPPDPPVAGAVATFLQRANARTYAGAYVIGTVAVIGMIFVALASALCLPVERRADSGSRRHRKEEARSPRR